MMAALKRAVFGEDDLTKQRRIFAHACAMVFERNPEGQIIWKHLKRVIESASFVQGQPDTTALNEGKRALVSEIAAAIEYYNKGMDHDTVTVLTERPKDAD